MNILEARRRTLGKGVYKKTVEGNPAIAQGSLARRYPGITMQGWTEQNGTPTPEAPVPIVSAGTQNQETGKWEYEITITNAQTDPDKNQTVTLTSDRPLTKWDRLEKRNGQWGWVYKSAEIVLDGSEQNVEGFVLRNETVAVYYVEILEKQKGSDNVIIDKMRYEYGAWGGTTGEYTFSGHPVSKLIYLSIPVSEEGEGIKSWFTSNQLVLWYETAEETFVPLSESEQEAMNALYTFRPTTVLSNDCDCNMTLTYKTKKSLEVAT